MEWLSHVPGPSMLRLPPTQPMSYCRYPTAAPRGGAVRWLTPARQGPAAASTPAQRPNPAAKTVPTRCVCALASEDASARRRPPASAGLNTAPLAAKRCAQGPSVRVLHLRLGA